MYFIFENFKISWLFRYIIIYNFIVLVLAIAKKTYKSYIYLTFFFFYLILVFGLIGMELFAGKFD
jgi:uncharacterized membrane protein